jgi:dTDP-4-dehydrorhamnose reductase
VEWTYGSNGNNFVTKLISVAKSGKSLNVVDDQIGSPSATTEVSKAICSLVRKRAEGLFHFASSGYTSRYEMARFVFDKLGMAVDLNSCKTSDYKSAVQRPLNSCFNCSKIEALLDEPIKPWQEPLEKFLR